MIWERVPKSIYVHHIQLTFAVYDAIANFNIGRKATSMINDLLNIEAGKYTKGMCCQK